MRAARLVPEKPMEGQGVEGDYWLYTAIRRTLWPFVGTAVLFSLAGAGMQVYAPRATSIGEVIHHYNEAR